MAVRIYLTDITLCVKPMLLQTGKCIFIPEIIIKHNTSIQNILTSSAGRKQDILFSFLL